FRPGSYPICRAGGQHDVALRDLDERQGFASVYDVFDRALILMQQGNAAKQRQVFHVTTPGPGFV
ncbi:hypothetical protein, partial [Pseudomonas fragi]|uniref:hypothetical protein n=1 Tax=Pseudomonas fragi TaxID=296 RepID=UPI001F1763BC